MAITPYPNGDDAFENPSLLVSQDGLSWDLPCGLRNPLDIKPGTRYSDPAHYNSDPDLILFLKIKPWKKMFHGIYP